MKKESDSCNSGSCCSKEGGCSSKFVCSPCLYIWGAAFVIMLVLNYLGK